MIAARLVAAALVFLAPQGAAAQEAVLIEGARVFDGTGSRAKIADVLIEGERIAAVGRNVAAPDNAVRVDGRGKTLIPGLHDLHTHTRAPAYDAPEDIAKAWAGYLLAGVTTINDYSVSGEMIGPIRKLTKQPGAAMWAPHLNQAVRFGVPGGHGTEAGWGNFFTLEATTPRAVHAQTPLALSYDPDLIKVFADGWRYGRDPDLMSMNEPTLAAIVADSHAAGKPVVTHTVTLEGAKVAAAAGVDSVAHGVGDALVDDELIALMRAKGTAYIATLVVYEPQQTRVLAPGEMAALGPGERAFEAKNSAGPPAVLPYDAKRWQFMRDNIRRLHKAHIPIGIGSDSGIEGVYHGPAAIREIGWLTRLGFTPAQALVAATRTSAAIMHEEADHGTIAPGMRADLVLVDGQPDKRIEDLWRVARVWVAGREAPLAELRRLRDAPAATPMPSIPMAGPIMTGARADGRTDLDTLPVASTDPGTDHSDLVALKGSGGEPTFLAAQMGAAPRPYVQWILPLTKGPVLVADASKFTGIELKAKGKGAYRVVLDSYGLDASEWFAAPFEAGNGAKSIRIPFAAFASRNAQARLDIAQLRALRIQLLGETGGTASLELAAVRFY
jgi:imidazolonepropionase-like amidohydrolase